MVPGGGSSWASPLPGRPSGRFPQPSSARPQQPRCPGDAVAVATAGGGEGAGLPPRSPAWTRRTQPHPRSILAPHRGSVPPMLAPGVHSRAPRVPQSHRGTQKRPHLARLPGRGCSWAVGSGPGNWTCPLYLWDGLWGAIPRASNSSGCKGLVVGGRDSENPGGLLGGNMYFAADHQGSGWLEAWKRVQGPYVCVCAGTEVTSGCPGDPSVLASWIWMELLGQGGPCVCPN